MKLTPALQKTSEEVGIYTEQFPYAMDNCSDFEALKKYRDQFLFPKVTDQQPLLSKIKKAGDNMVYLCGHSLGLQNKFVREAILKELEKWHEHGVEGHFNRGAVDTEPWVTYDETPLEYLAELVGAKPKEVVAMNTLTLNLHCLMNAFYKPTKNRYKILVEEGLFPSDYIACMTQLEKHGYSEEGIVKIKREAGGYDIQTEEILRMIKENEDSLCLVLIGGVQYLSGQFFEIEKIGAYLADKDIVFGVDLAHAVGNVELRLHEWQVDFSCYCSYKYLNSGPGGVGGAFIHEKHLGKLFNVEERRGFLGGWWSHRLKDRFDMREELIPTQTALAWQVSNSPVLSMAMLNTNLKMFHHAGMGKLRIKSESLTRYLEVLLIKKLSDHVQIVTPGFNRKAERGCMLCLRFYKVQVDVLYDIMAGEGLIADTRKPDIMRVAPCPLYNSFQDVHDFVAMLEFALGKVLES